LFQTKSENCPISQNIKRLGPSAEECAKIISEESPDICFISSFAFSYSYEALSLAKHLKKILPDLAIVLAALVQALILFILLRIRTLILCWLVKLRFQLSFLSMHLFIKQLDMKMFQIFFGK